MTVSNEELQAFSRYVEEKIESGGADLSLEQCLCLWRLEHSQTGGVDGRSAFDVLSAAGFLGCISTGIKNLSTNSEHMTDFGKS